MTFTLPTKELVERYHTAGLTNHTYTEIENAVSEWESSNTRYIDAIERGYNILKKWDTGASIYWGYPEPAGELIKLIHDHKNRPLGLYINKNHPETWPVTIWRKESRKADRMVKRINKVLADLG
jgi:hypothetical protein